MDELDLRHPARGLFAERFTLPLAQAGGPPLRRIAQWISATRKTDDRGRPITVPAQRISDWRRGRDVPASFSPLAAVLKPLIHRARRTAPGAPVEGLHGLRTWRLWWREASASPKAPVSDYGAEAASDTTTPSDEKRGSCRGYRSVRCREVITAPSRLGNGPDRSTAGMERHGRSAGENHDAGLFSACAAEPERP
ncbi:hypothetical protein JOF41_003575 [Saccharothrix coeruleofusca]|nr:hypothetical protein [Saccharothrix coeruleofusca]MBP2337397.1 hypothetical protein [Saccharothrix coeruleofusca]